MAAIPSSRLQGASNTIPLCALAKSTPAPSITLRISGTTNFWSRDFLRMRVAFASGLSKVSWARSD